MEHVPNVLNTKFQLKIIRLVWILNAEIDRLSQLMVNVKIANSLVKEDRRLLVVTNVALMYVMRDRSYLRMELVKHVKNISSHLKMQEGVFRMIVDLEIFDYLTAAATNVVLMNYQSYLISMNVTNLNVAIMRKFL